ncbi:type III secretion system export apparatus subunit SctR [Rhizobium sp. FKY42]|uniref:type III secretion system export apparatus subunit SctR n=1 Tax=Rhizobium sp. FKY42 TaxID=2562310 RepID=UPI0010C0DB59|nr:type III secretion system export apparatus subunit SctR [Rhizobium sp. FKY42]
MNQDMLLYQSLAALTAVSMLPVLAVVASSFTKISVVLLIVRNAIGIQQTPPNLLIFVVAIVLTAFIMNPVLQATWEQYLTHNALFTSSTTFFTGFNYVSEPLVQFMKKYADPEVRTFFIEAARRIWNDAPGVTFNEDDLTILAPSFLVSELTRAFEIGFLIYLPFLMIDFAISAILVALGMSMMSPTVVSTPVKLLLFVSIDGWRRLLEGLVLTYAN